jgi:predicted enzyme related to lactoylglutathione lyase
MPNPVTHWETLGKKGKKLQDYYAGLFGWHIDANNPMDYGMVDTHAGKGANGGVGPSDQGPLVTVYVEVDDVQTYLDKAVKMGGKVVVPLTTVPGQVTFAHFADPEGNVIGLSLSGSMG